MFILEPMTKELLQSTINNWKEILSTPDLPFSPVGYESFLSYCTQILKQPENHRDANFYMVRKNTEDFASGIFVVTIALPNTPNANMKILESRTTPKLDSRWDSDNRMPYMERLSLISLILITGFVDLYQVSITQYKCAKLKIFTNKQADQNLFLRLFEVLKEGPETGPAAGDAISVELENQGRWVIFSTSQTS